jgi:two-component system alkaline phosphatase synthesis response regulator PhoP
MTVLVVDDSRIDRTLMEKILAGEDFKTLVAGNGEDALELYQQNDVDIAILDWMMPPTGGLTLCQEMREIERNKGTFCYIIMVTAKNEVEDEMRAFESGVNDFISKPFDHGVFIARVRAGKRVVEERNALVSNKEERQ